MQSLIQKNQYKQQKVLLQRLKIKTQLLEVYKKEIIDKFMI